MCEFQLCCPFVLLSNALRDEICDNSSDHLAQRKLVLSSQKLIFESPVLSLQTIVCVDAHKQPFLAECTNPSLDGITKK